ncbi:MAG: tRNA pseudouridine(55) synthase TruB [Clostridia bacterium]|nr:tRNA pseudouridine(55) synthase TruB [Clostridia bacterium]
MNGLINLYKPAGMTSFAAVARVRRILGEKKVGHAGTLDPEATGILPICVGKGTRCADYFLTFPKTYRAELTFGLSTDTGDIWGTVLEEKDASFVTEDAFTAILPQFVGEIEQMPPAYSALKIGGVPAYKLARKGQTPDLAARTIRIYAITLLSFGQGKAEIEVTCGRGTYIRTLCEDVAKALGTCATMSSLERISYGPFDKAHAVTLEDLEANPQLMAMDLILEHLPRVDLTPAEEDNYRHGRPTKISESVAGECRVYGADGTLIGVGEAASRGIRGVKYLGD